MRILTFTHLFPNAAQPTWGIFVYQRVAHIAKLPGNEVVVVSPVPYVPRWLPGKGLARYKLVPKNEVIDGVTVLHPRYLHIPKIAMPLHGWLLFLGCLKLVRGLHRDTRFDCIDSHWIYPDGFAAVLFGKSLKIPVFCSARGTDINVYPKFVTMRPLIRWLLRQATGIVAVSGALKQAIADLGVPQEQIRVIGNGIDVERFHPMERRVAREKLGLPFDAQLVIAVGTLNEHKNHSLLISAIARMAPRFPRLFVAILGEGPLRKPLLQLVNEHNIQDRVLLPGNQRNEDLVWWYNAADISCLSSLREGWPNVLMESLACGTPVVATQVGGVPEIITSSDYGILCQPNLPEFAAALETALRKPWDRAAIVRYARGRTWTEVAREVQSFFSERTTAFQLELG